MEEVAPPGVFLSFRHPGGEVIAQMEREGKAVRSLSVDGQKESISGS